jgi:undecaprenyl-diphosphatase
MGVSPETKQSRPISDDGKPLLIVRLLIIVVGIAAFFLLAVEVNRGDTQHFDEQALRSLREPNDDKVPRGPVALQEAARDITSLGGYALSILLVTIVTIFLACDGKHGAARFLLAAVIGGWLLQKGLKALIGRPRPDVVPRLMPVDSTSFPSGHSMMSAIIFLTLGVILSRLELKRPHLRIYFLSVAFLLTGLVGLSRVYLGVHYPTDVLAGWTAGLVWAMLCSLVAEYLQRRGAVETEL